MNDAARWIIGQGIVLLGVGCEIVQHARILDYRRAQMRLRGKYGIADHTPVLAYGSEQEANIAERARHERTSPRYALTSGTTATPKRLLYPAKRIARARWAFIEAFARAAVRTPGQRQSLYVFSNLQLDDSLTSLMLVEGGPTSFMAALQAPDRVQHQSEIRALADRYGVAALRLWVLCLANPGVLYSTNPSTLAGFLDDMRMEWPTVSALIRDFVTRPHLLSHAVHSAANKLTSRGAASRLRCAAESDAPLQLSDIAPGVHAYSCWTGGYVQPFLTRLAVHLPASRYRLIPMYSMSTETPETTPCFQDGRTAFVPLAPGVLFEFLPDEVDDNSLRVLMPQALEVGRSYTMVVSDGYGLRRYQTDDVFACVGHVRALPDLRFVRRQSLAYSFTGEKLTGAQAGLVIDQLRSEMSQLPDDAFLTCMPSHPATPGEHAHYRLLLVDAHAGRDPAFLNDLAVRCDALFAQANLEYRAKRESGRLGPVRASALRMDEFLSRTGGGRREAQFKLLPLYPSLWEREEEQCIPPCSLHEAEVRD